MRSSGRPVPAPSSAGRPEFPREARLRRHDAHLDGPWDVSGLCRSTDLDVRAPGAKASQRPMCTTAVAPALELTLSPAPPEPITTPEDTLRRAGISSERQAVYQRRMSSLLAGRGGGPEHAGAPRGIQLDSPAILPRRQCG